MDVSQPSNTKINNSSSVSDDDDNNNKEQISSSLQQDTDTNTPKPESRRLTLEDKKAALAARSLAGRPRRPTGSRPISLPSPATVVEATTATKATTVREDQGPRRTVLRQSAPPRSGPTDSDQDTLDDLERERNITMADKRAALESRLQRGRPRRSTQPPRVSEVETTDTHDNQRRDTLRQSAPPLSRNTPSSSDQDNNEPKGKRNIITIDDKRAALESKLKLGCPRRSIEPSRVPATDATATHGDQGQRRDVPRQSAPPRPNTTSFDSDPERTGNITMNDKRAALESRLQLGRPRRSPQPPQAAENRQGSANSVRTSPSPPPRVAPCKNLVEAEESMAACIGNRQYGKRSMLSHSVTQHADLNTATNDSPHEENKETKPGGGITMQDNRAALESRLQIGRLRRSTLPPRAPPCQETNAKNYRALCRSTLHPTAPVSSRETPSDVEAPTPAATTGAICEIKGERRSLLLRPGSIQVGNSLDAEGPKDHNEPQQQGGIVTMDDKRAALESRLRKRDHRHSAVPPLTLTQKTSRKFDHPDPELLTPPMAATATLVGAKATIVFPEHPGERRHLFSGTTTQGSDESGGEIPANNSSCQHDPLDTSSANITDGTLGEIEMEPSLNDVQTSQQFQRKLAPGAFAIGSASESSLVLSFRSTRSNELSNWKSREGSRDALGTDLGRVGDLAKAVVVDEDPFRPAAVEFDPDGKRMKRRTFRDLLPYIILGIAILGGIVAVRILFRAPTPSESRRLIELREILRPYEAFDETSPAFRKALSWISDADGLTLHPYDPLLLQRFCLVHFYYSTTVHSNWTVCNPPQLNEDAFCRGRIGIGNRWLTSTPECRWTGIKCNSENQIIIINCLGMGLSGNVPDHLVLLSELKKIVLSSNTLNGPIPSVLPKTINSLVLGDNSLTGTLPSNLASYSSLVLLELSRNSLSGGIPAELPAGLVDLNLFGNSLTGSIPPSIYNLHKLTWLQLDHNSLTGSISSHVSGLSLLENFLVGSNMLRGSIPDQLYSLSRLKRLVLTNNEIIGSVSDHLCELTMLVKLDVRGNTLSGTIPPVHGDNLIDLKSALFSGNDLVGSVPEGLCPRRVGDALEADCKPDDDGTVEVLCSCCSTCCNNKGKQCHNSQF